ncbi:hypothetical protein Tco_0222844 [Tanacetum coccineum]
MVPLLCSDDTETMAVIGAQASETSSKAKVEACGSKAKLQASTKTLIVKSPVPITNCVLRLANAKTRDAIKGKTFGVKIQWLLLEEKIEKRSFRMDSDVNQLYMLCFFVLMYGIDV